MTQKNQWGRKQEQRETKQPTCCSRAVMAEGAKQRSVGNTPRPSTCDSLVISRHLGPDQQSSISNTPGRGVTPYERVLNIEPVQMHQPFCCHRDTQQNDLDEILKGVVAFALVIPIPRLPDTDTDTGIWASADIEYDLSGDIYINFITGSRPNRQQ